MNCCGCWVCCSGAYAICIGIAVDNGSIDEVGVGEATGVVDAAAARNASASAASPSSEVDRREERCWDDGLSWDTLIADGGFDNETAR